MAAHTGDRARQTVVLYCGRCDAAVSVRQGDEIPQCPNGHTEFKRRMQQRRARR